MNIPLDRTSRVLYINDIDLDEESDPSQSNRLQPSNRDLLLKSQNSRILVIDDEPFNLKAMEIILQLASRDLKLDTDII
jgi:hypothetical protein